VNRFSPGYRQIVRVLNRLALRCHLLVERRKLGRLETELGLLGWQQADYNEATQDEIRKLADYERDQARLTNESADLGNGINELAERRAKEKTEYTAQKASFEASLAELEKPLAALRRKLAARRRAQEKVEKSVAVLEAKMEEAAQDPKIAGARTSEERVELIRFDYRFREVPHKLKSARARLAGIKEEVRGEETDLERNLPVLNALEERQLANQTQVNAQDAELEKEISARKRAKRKLEKEINALEKAKSHPYREIGRALADCEIAPMNQPGALENVCAQRLRIRALESTLGASLEESRREPREALLNSWQWWVALVGALVILAIFGTLVIKVVFVLFPRHGSR
jgi:chromosome segregation ATPase